MTHIQENRTKTYVNIHNDNKKNAVNKTKIKTGVVD